MPTKKVDEEAVREVVEKYVEAINKLDFETAYEYARRLEAMVSFSPYLVKLVRVIHSMAITGQNSIMDDLLEVLMYVISLINLR